MQVSISFHRTLSVAIDTVHHHLAIVRGSNVSLSSSQIQSAISAFAGNYGKGG